MDRTRKTRKARLKRRRDSGAVWMRGDIPQHIAEWLIEKGFIRAVGDTTPEEWGAAGVRALEYAKTQETRR